MLMPGAALIFRSTSLVSPTLYVPPKHPAASKLLRHGSAPVPTQQHPKGAKIMARAQTLPVGAALPLLAGAAPLPSKAPPPGMSKASPPALALGGIKAAPLEAVPEDSPSPASSFTLPGSAAAAAAAALLAEAAEAAAEDVASRAHAAGSSSAGESQEFEGAGDSLANWQPSRPLFKTSSIHAAALQAAPEYSWLPASPAAAGAAGTSSGGDRPSARGQANPLFRTGSSKKVAPEPERSSSVGQRSGRASTAAAAAIAIDMGAGAGMV